MAEFRTDVVSELAYDSLFPARTGRPSGGRNLWHQAGTDCRSSPVRFLTCLWRCREHANATLPLQAGRPAARTTRSGISDPDWETASQALDDLMRKLLVVHRLLEAEERLAKRTPRADPL